jgi:serine/threonine-protein kinase
MARVFVARDEQLGRDVVVKVLAPELAQALSAERFAREIRLAARLQEPHIVPVLAAGTTVDGLPWYAMPYVEGESLRARLAQGPVPLREAVGILRDLARALAYAHGRGIVHRDIKPENVLLSSGTAMVTDFGIAKALSASRTLAPDPTDRGTLTQFGTALGTPAYMAPEQVAADPEVDHRADLYAWGVVAYELLAGRHPFAGKTAPQQLLAAHLAEVPAPLATTGSVGRAVPPPLAATVARCLAKEPAARPASAAALLAELDEALGMAIGTRSARGARIGALAALVLLVVAVAGVAWRTRSAPESTEAAGTVMLAVLPFEHAGPADRAVFTDGLTDVLTAKLGALPGLAVIDRQSAAQYRRTTKTAKQIGAELGVPYLLQGVVRWARDDAGAWRAQVTPTLVDARAGTTRWTGEPALITPADPFTAQGAVATDVAEALVVQLRPTDRAALARRLTTNPDAFAAWVRGSETMATATRGTWNTAGVQRAAAELASAVALDSSFGEAWGELALAYGSLAVTGHDGAAGEARLRATLARALVYVPRQPRVLLALAFTRQLLDGDTVAADTLARRALTLRPNDRAVLGMASSLLFARGQYDSAYALARRAAVLDPRDVGALRNAGGQAIELRRWDAARRYADAITALDSSEQVGWTLRLRLADLRADTLALQRELAGALAHVARPDNAVLQYSVRAGGGYGARYVALSARELGVTILYDSVWSYYNNKADVFLDRNEPARANVYYDSIRTLLTGRSLGGPEGPNLLALRALAEVALGDAGASRRTLTEAVALARRTAGRADLTDLLSVTALAAVHARLGEPEAAVRWLAVGLANPGGGWTARVYARDPSLRALHGTEAFRRLLREHPE